MTLKSDNNKNDSNKTQNEKKKKSFLHLLFINLFGGKKKMTIMEEEMLQNEGVEEEIESPGQIIWSSFKSDKVAMTALIIFIIIVIVSVIGPLVNPIDLSFSEVSQQHIPPGRNLMKYPKALEGKVQDISTGPKFSVATSTDGKLYIWGKTKITDTIDLRKVPKDMGNIVKLAAGYDHILALNDEGQLFAWGNGRQRQTDIPDEVIGLTNISDIVAGYQNSIVLTEDGHMYYFGNYMNNDIDLFHPYQGQLQKVVVTSDAVLGLTFDGEVVYLGSQNTAYSRIPEDMGNIVDLAATAATVAAVNEEGQVFVWGNISAKKGEGNIPETDSKIVSLQGGRYHYTAMTEDGQIVSWGDNTYKQATVPSSVVSADIENYYTGFYQNYAVTSQGDILTWGLKGYLLGSDELGRDIFNRLLNGARLSLFIGAIAVIISTFIGIIVGGISGYFGGRVDIVLQRIAEMVASLPFLPLAMILSALIGHSMSPRQRIFLIMFILGILSWTGLQRLVRAQILSIREQEYVLAARALGVKEWKIIFRHILPNVFSAIIVSTTLSFASSILTEASLSYLGFGVQAPYPTWGNMLYGANNSVVIQNYWWRWVFASIILSISVVSINTIGDGLRDAVDPKTQER